MGTKTGPGAKPAPTERTFELVARALDIAYYEWWLATDAFYTSSALQQLFGHDPSIWNWERLLQLIHPDDVAGYRAAIHAHITGSDERSEVTYRFRMPDGAYVWVHQHNVVERGPDGRVTRMVGTVANITAAVEREAENLALIARQDASIEILKTISASPGNLAPVFDAILQKAHILCGADIGSLNIFDGAQFRAVATHGFPEPFGALVRQAHPPGRYDQLMLDSERSQHIIDMQLELEQQDDDEQLRGTFAHLDVRTGLRVPLRKDGVYLGDIVAYRLTVRPFSDKEIALLESFAAQAVIAMENARLLNELQVRTEDLQQSLEYQTATSDVLKVISRSTFDLQPVLDTVVETAARLCSADVASINLRTGELWRQVANVGASAEYLAHARALGAWTMPVDGQTVTQRVVRERAIVHVEDATTLDGYREATLRLSGQRTTFGVPLLRDGEVIGVIILARRHVELFTQRQIDLVATFADQAVIAIENTRLLTEQQEALARQTATAEILQTINASPGDLAPVFDKMLEKALLLCGAAFGSLVTFQGRDITSHASRSLEEKLVPGKPDVIFPGGPGERLINSRRAVHNPDLRTEPNYGIDPGMTEFIDRRGVRSYVAVPLLKDGAAIGAFCMWRQEARAFSDKEITLLESFAAQAVIAMDNARLLNELQARTAELAERNSDFAERIDQQSATIDVLKLMSASPDDTQPVFDQIVRRARDLSNADAAALHEYDGTLVHYRAIRGPSVKSVAELAAFSPEGASYVAMWPCPPTRGSISCRAILDREILHVRDFSALTDIDPALRNVQTGAQLSVPLMRDGAAIGAISLMSYQPGGFTDSQIELLKTFAEQAVIAIGSVATYKALRQRTAELTQSVAAAEAALSDLKRAQDRLVQSEKRASLGQLTAGIAHEIKNPLNFVNNFSDLSIELIDELQELLGPAPLADTTRSEVDDLTTLIKSNLEKVVQHGRRADSIVKNMLLHSRASGGDMRDVDLNATVEEALNLAYHGARAEKPGFNITLERNFDPAAGTVALYPQEFTRVLLNLFSNGFYATTQKADARDYDPTLTVSTEARPGEVVIRIRDNGTGIPASVRARMFEPFFTTKPAGEGTGLGLSLSHDIIVKQHNGSITVDSVAGSHTEFTVTIPRASTGTTP